MSGDQLTKASERGVIKTPWGTVRAIDGLLQRCNKPTNKEVKNVLSYYSGHYESYGINCLAVVKGDLHFMYFGVISPGSTNDIASYAMSKNEGDS